MDAGLDGLTPAMTPLPGIAGKAVGDGPGAAGGGVYLQAQVVVETGLGCVRSIESVVVTGVNTLG